MATIIIYTDGACSNNGHGNAVACGSYAIYAMSGYLNYREEMHEELLNKSPIRHYPRIDLELDPKVKPTNNLAEAKTLLLAVRYIVGRYNASFSQDTKFYFCMDSLLIRNQVIGVCETKDPYLREIRNEIRRLLSIYPPQNIEFRWISGVTMKKSVIGH